MKHIGPIRNRMPGVRLIDVHSEDEEANEAKWRPSDCIESDEAEAEVARATGAPQS